MESGRRKGLSGVLSSLSLVCVLLDLQLDGRLSPETWFCCGVVIIRNADIDTSPLLCKDRSKDLLWLIFVTLQNRLLKL